MSAVRASEDDYAHCQALVRAADKDRFIATLFAPAERRPHLFALYAFNLEIARIGGSREVGGICVAVGV